MTLSLVAIVTPCLPVIPFQLSMYTGSGPATLDRQGLSSWDHSGVLCEASLFVIPEDVRTS
jgi:hypothetical protein